VAWSRTSSLQPGGRRTTSSFGSVNDERRRTAGRRKPILDREKKNSSSNNRRTLGVQSRVPLALLPPPPLSPCPDQLTEGKIKATGRGGEAVPPGLHGWAPARPRGCRARAQVGRTKQQGADSEGERGCSGGSGAPTWGKQRYGILLCQSLSYPHSSKKNPMEKKQGTCAWICH